MYRSWPSKGRVSIEVTLPDGVESILAMPPESLSFSIKRSGKISMKTEILPAVPAHLSIRQEINLKPVVVLPDEYPQLLKIHGILGQRGTTILLLKMKKAA